MKFSDVLSERLAEPEFELKAEGEMYDGGWFAGGVKADSHIACRAHAVPLPCRAAKDLECVFPI